MNPNNNNSPMKPQMNIDFSKTTPVVSEKGNQIFSEGVILRKVSKFLIGSDKDGIIPVPVFYDIKTGEVLLDMLPKELREEFQKYNKELFRTDNLNPDPSAETAG